MNIFFTFDNNFLPQAGTSICSLCENNKEAENINIFIASHKISDSNKLKLEELVESYGRSLNIIELNNLESYFDFEFDSGGWPPVTLARLLIDRLLPIDVERVIYLDADVIVRGSLENLWNIDMGDKVLGMSIEPTTDKDRKKKLGLDDYPYYNAGVMLINLKRWRDSHACKRIFDFYRKNDGKLFAADQDAINGTLRDDIYTLLPKYNFYNIYYQYPYKFMKKIMGKVKYISEDEYIDSVANPVIIHFLGEERPWRAGNTHRYKDEYKFYLNKTIWENTPDEDGWNTYFICWRIFNLTTSLFPSLRYKIISYLIPKFIAYRSKKRKE